MSVANTVIMITIYSVQVRGRQEDQKLLKEDECQANNELKSDVNGFKPCFVFYR